MFRRAFLASTGALAALPAVAQPRMRRAPDIERIFDRGRLVAALAGFAVPPFVTLGTDGALGGHDIALAQGMARALGLPVAFERAASFDAIIDSVASGTADLGLGRLSATLARAELVRFSRPYLVLHDALLVSRPRFARLAPDGEPAAALKAGDAPLGIVPGTAAPLQLRAVVLPETRDPIAVALPWDSFQLLAWVDLYLDSTGPPPTVEQLLGQSEKAAE